MTAGDRSQAKYDVIKFSTDSNIQKFTNNYNTKDINIFET
jgi:hypothetical protein